MQRTLILAFMLTAGCMRAPDKGTAIGNPGVLALTLADGESGVEFVSGTATATEIALIGGETTDVLGTDVGLDLMGTTFQPELGDWASLTITFNGGVTLATATLERTIAVDGIDVVGAFSTESALLLEFGGTDWLKQNAWETGPDSEVEQALLHATALYVDANADGVLDDDEATAVACGSCGDTGESR